MRGVPILLSAFLALCVPAGAQMSVTTIGATDAVSCFNNASDDFSTDTSPCDRALADHATSPRDRVKTLVNRGIIHNRNGNLQAALDDFNTALDLDNDLAEAYLNRGNTWFLSGQLDSALADYEKALDLGVGKPWAAWYNIGLAYDAQEETEKATEAYKKALEANPNFTLAQRKLEDRQ